MPRNRLALMGVAAIGIICLAALAACGGGQSDTGSLEMGTHRAFETDEEETMPQSFTSTAMVVTYGNGQLLFVDQDNGTPYIPGLDTAEIVGADGVTMAPEGLAAGNIVSVTGNGIMLESYPGRYPGITRIEVTETGNPEDANAYDELVAQIWQPADPAEPAHGTLEYTTDLAIAALMLQPYGYTWSFEENGEAQAVAVDAAHPVQMAEGDLVDARLASPTEATLTFDHEVRSVRVTRWSEADIADAAEAAGAPSAVDAAALAHEEVTVNTADDLATEGCTLTVEPGWRYVVEAVFDAGEVTYAFTVRAA